MEFVEVDPRLKMVKDSEHAVWQKEYYICCVDWLQYSTNLLSDRLRKEFSVPLKIGYGNKFYLERRETENTESLIGNRSKNNKRFSIRVKKESLETFLSDGLEADSVFQRIDFKIDCENKLEAMQFLVGLPFSGYIRSKEGVTYYFGDRKSQLFERVYYLNERGCWRYEIELKLRTDRNNKNITSKLHYLVASELFHVEQSCILLGESALSVDSVSKSRKIELDFVAKSEYFKPSYSFYYSLSDIEKRYLEASISSLYNKGRSWAWVMCIYKNKVDTNSLN